MGWKKAQKLIPKWKILKDDNVAQVLLTLPYSFSQLGMVSEIIFQLFYGIMGSWTAYLISVLYIEYRARKEKENMSFKNHVIQWFEILDGLLGPYWKAIGLAFNCTFLLFGSVIQLIGCASNIYYVNDKLDKRTWTYIFGPCCATTVFISSFHKYWIWSFLDLGMTTYITWYLTITTLINGQLFLCVKPTISLPLDESGATEARFANLCKNGLGLDKSLMRQAMAFFKESKHIMLDNISAIGSGSVLSDKELKTIVSNEDGDNPHAECCV